MTAIDQFKDELGVGKIAFGQRMPDSWQTLPPTTIPVPLIEILRELIDRLEALEQRMEKLSW